MARYFMTRCLLICGLNEPTTGHQFYNQTQNRSNSFRILSMTSMDILIFLAFIVGASLSGYVLSHLKLVFEKLKSNHGRSIFAIGFVAFLLFSVSHPKITQLVVEGFGLKAKLASYEKQIQTRETVVAQLDEKIRSQNEQLEGIKKNLETYAAKLTTPFNKSLSILQKNNEAVAVFPGGSVAVNPNLLTGSDSEIIQPAEFKTLKNSEWVVTYWNHRPNPDSVQGSSAWPVYLMQNNIPSTNQKTQGNKALIFDTALKTYRTQELSDAEQIYLKGVLEKTQLPKN
jgi:hypothetical protein